MTKKKSRAKRAKRAPRILIYGMSVETWTKRHGVEPFSAQCCVCGRMQTTTIPFVQGTLRGLQAPPCSCGHPYPPYAMVRDSRYGDLFSGGAPGAIGSLAE